MFDKSGTVTVFTGMLFEHGSKQEENMGGGGGGGDGANTVTRVEWEVGSGKWEVGSGKWEVSAPMNLTQWAG